MFSTTSARAAYTACAAGAGTRYSSTGVGTAYPTGASESYSPTGAGAAHLTGASHMYATTGVDAASLPLPQQAKCNSPLFWCCAPNGRKRDVKCRTCVGLCRCEVLHDWRWSSAGRCWRDVLPTSERAKKDAAGAMYSSTCARHCGSWYDVFHDGSKSNERRCRRNVLSHARKSNVRHCGSTYDDSTTGRE